MQRQAAGKNGIMPLPILYSYRRCPYAMRARMALRYSGIQVEMREIALKQKPQHMLALSPKGTVPVLVLNDGSVIDESLDIMRWALAQHDPEDWQLADASSIQLAEGLIAENDGQFKSALDRYKYAVRFPEQPAAVYRAEGELFLQKLEQRLHGQPYLFGNQRSLADMAIFPFIRQFAGVDAAWFTASPYQVLKAWLSVLVESELFTGIMQKHPPWIETS